MNQSDLLNFEITSRFVKFTQGASLNESEFILIANCTPSCEKTLILHFRAFFLPFLTPH